MTSRFQRHGEPDELEERVLALLADSQFQGHPLHQALEQVMERMLQQLTRLERITLISDRYHSQASDRYRNLAGRYERQIHRLEKAIRISDRYQRSLNDLNRILREASTHDSLTGLPNRKMMLDCCHLADERVEREPCTYSLLAIDADRFKVINDTYGHDLGDQVLIQLARTFQASIRDGDTCARWGGEEFLAILPGADQMTARLVADRLLNNVRAIRVFFDEVEIQPRVSIGIATHQPGEKYNDVYQRADTALLQAKRQGRDRCVVAHASPTARVGRASADSEP